MTKGVHGGFGAVGGGAIMEKAAPEPEIPDVTGLPTWLIHFLLFISRGKTRPA